MGTKTSLKIANGFGYAYSYYCLLLGGIVFGVILAILSVALSATILIEAKKPTLQESDDSSLGNLVERLRSDPRALFALGYSIMLSILYLFNVGYDPLPQSQFPLPALPSVGAIPVAYILAMILNVLITRNIGTRITCARIMQIVIVLPIIKLFIMEINTIEIPGIRSFIFLIIMLLFLYAGPAIVFFMGSISLGCTKKRKR